jgi:hypothetical protein
LHNFGKRWERRVEACGGAASAKHAAYDSQAADFQNISSSDIDCHCK